MVDYDTAVANMVAGRITRADARAILKVEEACAHPCPHLLAYLRPVAANRRDSSRSDAARARTVNRRKARLIKSTALFLAFAFPADTSAFAPDAR